MSEEKEPYEACGRYKVTLRNGQNFYFTMGENFIQCCPPFENRPENIETRMLLDDFCDAITEAMGGTNK